MIRMGETPSTEKANTVQNTKERGAAKTAKSGGGEPGPGTIASSSDEVVVTSSSVDSSSATSVVVVGPTIDASRRVPPEPASPPPPDGRTNTTNPTTTHVRASPTHHHHNEDASHHATTATRSASQTKRLRQAAQAAAATVPTSLGQAAAVKAGELAARRLIGIPKNLGTANNNSTSTSTSTGGDESRTKATAPSVQQPTLTVVPDTKRTAAGISSATREASVPIATKQHVVAHALALDDFGEMPHHSNKPAAGWVIQHALAAAAHTNQSPVGSPPDTMSAAVQPPQGSTGIPSNTSKRSPIVATRATTPTSPTMGLDESTAPEAVSSSNSSRQNPALSSIDMPQDRMIIKDTAPAHVDTTNTTTDPPQRSKYRATIDNSLVGQVQKAEKLDVICGIDRECQRHHGNLEFRKLVKKYRPMYQGTVTTNGTTTTTWRTHVPRSEKARIIRSIMGIVVTWKPGGRFVRYQHETKTWHVVGEHGIYEKVQHALRHKSKLVSGEKKRGRKRDRLSDVGDQYPNDPEFQTVFALQQKILAELVYEDFGKAKGKPLLKQVDKMFRISARKRAIAASATAKRDTKKQHQNPPEASLSSLTFPPTAAVSAWARNNGDGAVPSCRENGGATPNTDSRAAEGPLPRTSDAILLQAYAQTTESLSRGKNGNGAIGRRTENETAIETKTDGTATDSVGHDSSDDEDDDDDKSDATTQEDSVRLDIHIDTELPISEPAREDVLCGKGGRTNLNFGNIRLRRLVNHSKVVYHHVGNISGQQRIKGCLSQSIVETVRLSGGRFVRQDKKTGMWKDIGEIESKLKVSQALRDSSALWNMEGKERSKEEGAQAETDAAAGTESTPPFGAKPSNKKAMYEREVQFPYGNVQGAATAKPGTGTKKTAAKKSTNNGAKRSLKNSATTNPRKSAKTTTKGSPTGTVSGPPMNFSLPSVDATLHCPPTTAVEQTSAHMAMLSDMFKQPSCSTPGQFDDPVTEPPVPRHMTAGQHGCRYGHGGLHRLSAMNGQAANTWSLASTVQLPPGRISGSSLAQGYQGLHPLPLKATMPSRLPYSQMTVPNNTSDLPAHERDAGLALLAFTRRNDMNTSGSMERQPFASPFALPATGEPFAGRTPAVVSLDFPSGPNRGWQNTGANHTQN